MIRTWKIAVIAAAAAGTIGLGAPRAHADWMRNHGVDIAAGGGVTGFVQGEARDQATTGGSWNARLGLGQNKLLGVEGQYIGSAQDFNGPAGGQLVGTQVSGDLRLNLGTFRIQPFVLGGAGYQWFRTNNLSGNMAGDIPVRTGNQVVVPVGAGVATYLGRHNRFNVDARFNYDIGTNSNLIGNQRADMWNASANLGYVF